MLVSCTLRAAVSVLLVGFSENAPNYTIHRNNEGLHAAISKLQVNFQKRYRLIQRTFTCLRLKMHYPLSSACFVQCL